MLTWYVDCTSGMGRFNKKNAEKSLFILPGQGNITKVFDICSLSNSYNISPELNTFDLHILKQCCVTSLLVRSVPVLQWSWHPKKPWKLKLAMLWPFWTPLRVAGDGQNGSLPPPYICDMWYVCDTAKKVARKAKKCWKWQYYGHFKTLGRWPMAKKTQMWIFIGTHDLGRLGTLLDDLLLSFTSCFRGPFLKAVHVCRDKKLWKCTRSQCRLERVFQTLAQPGSMNDQWWFVAMLFQIWKFNSASSQNDDGSVKIFGLTNLSTVEWIGWYVRPGQARSGMISDWMTGNAGGEGR